MLYNERIDPKNNKLKKIMNISVYNRDVTMKKFNYSLKNFFKEANKSKNNFSYFKKAIGDFDDEVNNYVDKKLGIVSCKNKNLIKEYNKIQHYK